MEQGGPLAGCQQGLGYKQGPTVRLLLVVVEVSGEVLQQVGHTHSVGPGARTQGAESRRQDRDRLVISPVMAGAHSSPQSAAQLSVSRGTVRM